MRWRRSEIQESFYRLIFEYLQVMEFYRNSPRRLYGPDKIYYVVAKTHLNYPSFKEEIFCCYLLKN